MTKITMIAKNPIKYKDWKVNHLILIEWNVQQTFNNQIDKEDNKCLIIIFNQGTNICSKIKLDFLNKCYQEIALIMPFKRNFFIKDLVNELLNIHLSHSMNDWLFFIILILVNYYFYLKIKFK